VEEILAALQKPVRFGMYSACDGHFLSLLRKLSRIEVLDHLLLLAAIPKNRLDDHNLLFPVFTWRVLDNFGWEYADYLARPAIRFATRPPGPPGTDDVERLIDEYHLRGRDLRIRTGDDETQTVADLGIDIGDTNSFADIPHMIARAIGHGLSLEGAGEALSIGASLLFLRWRTRRPMDVHLNIDANVQRYLIGCDDLPAETKLRALLVWHSGPDVRIALRHLTDILDTVEQAAAAPSRDQSDLLEDMESLFRKIAAVERTDAGNAGEDEIDQLMFLAYRYASNRYEAEPLLALLARYVCRDESSEMHTYEHHQAMYEEIHTTRPELRWVHLISAVKGAAISVGPDPGIYRVALHYLSTQRCTSRFSRDSSEPDRD
jgi:hypothetical protein